MRLINMFAVLLAAVDLIGGYAIELQPYELIRSLEPLW